MDVAPYIVRAVHVAALAILSGSCLAPLIVERTRLTAPVQHRLRRCALVAAGCAVAAHFALVAVYVESLREGGALLTGLSLAEAWAQTWIGRTLLTQGAALLLVVLMLLIRAPPAVPGVGALLCLALGALAGHAAAGSESVLLSFAAVAHLGLAGLWFGFLPIFLVLRSDKESPGPGALVSILPRFSLFALPTMLGVLVTGAILALWTIGSWPALFGTQYGATICVKLGFVFVALCAAAMIRWRQLPRILRGGAQRPLLHLLAFELVVACGVVMAASVAAQTIPAAHDEILWPFSFRLAPTIAWQTTPFARERIVLGGCVVLLGLAGAALIRRRSGASLAGAVAIGAGACGLVLSVPAMTVAAYPTTYSHSPLPFDTDGVAAGARLFHDHCAICHGATGRGDGPAAAMLEPRPADLTAPHLGYHTHGDLFWWLTNGYPGAAMPGFSDVLSDAQRWHLVNYLLALSLGYQARVLGEKIVPHDPWLPAIDFRYADNNRRFALLSEMRGITSVLLVLITREAELARCKVLAQVADRFAAASGRLIAVVASEVNVESSALPVSSSFDFVIDSDDSITRAWSLYRRTLTTPDLNDTDPLPPRLEFLVDRFGFVRARWRSDESAGGAEVAAIEAAMRSLAVEPMIIESDPHAR
jgi:putative copper export protein/mono/diheme cytochrome c family protein